MAEISIRTAHSAEKVHVAKRYIDQSSILYGELSESFIETKILGEYFYFIL